MGGAWAVISWPEAVAATIWTINLCRLAHLYRSLDSLASLYCKLNLHISVTQNTLFRVAIVVITLIELKTIICMPDKSVLYI